MDNEKLFTLLREFYILWIRCESTRGCYSCCEPHDMRCPKARFSPRAKFSSESEGEIQCVCGRDRLSQLEAMIDSEMGTAT